MSLACFSELMITQRSKGVTRLEKIESLVNWKRVDYRLKKVLNRSGLGPTGYLPITLFKAMILQHLYGLSDPALEEMLYDRISFRRFCGLSLNSKIPDETTICRFRSSLSGHVDKLMRVVMDDLSRQGIALKTGAIIDASVIESSVKAPCGGEVNEHDPDAGWTKKGGRYHYGYKAHVSCDEQGLVRDVMVTGADTHDSQVFGQLLDGSESAVYADKAYGAKKNRRLLQDYGIKDCLMYKKKKGRSKQPQWQIQLNKFWGRTRSTVERVFAHWKTVMGLNKSRYIGTKKVQDHITFLAMTYNLMRATKIKPMIS